MHSSIRVSIEEINYFDFIKNDFLHQETILKQEKKLIDRQSEYTKLLSQSNKLRKFKFATFLAIVLISIITLIYKSSQRM